MNFLWRVLFAVSKLTVGVCFLISSEGVAEPLSVSVDRNLVFDKVTTGAGPQTVAPLSTRSSRFLIRGIPFTNVIVTLPNRDEPMKQKDFAIGVTQFRRDTMFQLPVIIGPLGRVFVSVGATRLTIPAKHPSGTYEGTHSITVRAALGGRVQTATAKHSVTVIRSLSLTKLKDMSFPDAFAGDPSQSISVDSSRSARFQLRGEPNSLFTVSIPGASRVKLTLPGGGISPQRSLTLSNFVSSPFPTGKLDSDGVAFLSVGATQSSVLQNQVAGNYSGAFTVRVTYQ